MVGNEEAVVRGGRSPRPRRASQVTEQGTHKTVKASFWPWLSNKILKTFKVCPVRSERDLRHLPLPVVAEPAALKTDNDL